MEAMVRAFENAAFVLLGIASRTEQILRAFEETGAASVAGTSCFYGQGFVPTGMKTS